MKPKQISRKLSDIECLCGFRSKKFTYVNSVFSFLAGVVLFALIYLTLSFFRGQCWAVDMFFHGGEKNRSAIPYYTVFLGSWALAILLIKIQKLHVQRKVLELNLLPDDSAFVLTGATARIILEKINLMVSNPADFVLLDRIQRALVNLKNGLKRDDDAFGEALKQKDEEIARLQARVAELGKEEASTE